MLFDYLQAERDERHYWEDKVRRLAARAPVDEAAVELERALSDYLEERSQAAEPFRSEAARTGRGIARMSLRNLAELMLRLWVPPPAAARPAARARGRAGR